MDLFLKISVLQAHFCWLEDVFIHAFLLFLGLFLKISRWVPLKSYSE